MSRRPAFSPGLVGGTPTDTMTPLVTTRAVSPPGSCWVRAWMPWEERGRIVSWRGGPAEAAGAPGGGGGGAPAPGITGGMPAPGTGTGVIGGEPGAGPGAGPGPGGAGGTPS